MAEEKWWIVRYWSTKGVFPIVAKPSAGGCLHEGFVSYGVGSDAFRSLEEALEEVEKRRKKKISSLERQLKKARELEVKVHQD